MSDGDIFDEIQQMITPLPTALDRYLNDHPLLLTTISIMKETFEKESDCLKVLNGLPNSCKSIVYCLMLAYQKRILIK